MTDMTPREAVEVLGRALGNMGDEGYNVTHATKALATLSALADRAGEAVAWHLESNGKDKYCVTRDIWWDEPGPSTREKFNVRPLVFGDIPPPAAPGASHD